MTNRSKLRETIMTIIYQITLYKKNNMEYNVDDVIKENIEIDSQPSRAMAQKSPASRWKQANVSPQVWAVRSLPMKPSRTRASIMLQCQ